MFTFEKLRVYQEALTFINKVYSFTNSFPDNEMFGITSQFRRAAVSIALNIAEGTSRTRKDFNHFLDLSKGSCFECVAIISISLKRKYINQIQYEILYSSCSSLSRMIANLKKSLLKTHNPEPITI
ncbi:MAG: four helix bundle protein [Candidatus Roizmanbacteria bacterium]|nr:MAG: four helix bundle protein [Candidatus Roizmanbacteria bacterium]